MVALQQQLRDFMVAQGVPAAEADLAAAECDKRIRDSAKLGFAIGLTVGLGTGNPGALIMALAASAGGGATALLGSASCAQVRDAASRLAWGH